MVVFSIGALRKNLVVSWKEEEHEEDLQTGSLEEYAIKAFNPSQALQDLDLPEVH